MILLLLKFDPTYRILRGNPAARSNFVTVNHHPTSKHESYMLGVRKELNSVTAKTVESSVDEPPSQRRVNPKIHDVIKKEVEKLLDAGLIYPSLIALGVVQTPEVPRDSQDYETLVLAVSTEFPHSDSFGISIANLLALSFYLLAHFINWPLIYEARGLGTDTKKGTKNKAKRQTGLGNGKDCEDKAKSKPKKSIKSKVNREKVNWSSQVNQVNRS
ncbi:hypothetical protein Tco_1336262 [Tanacetum coccineum]